MARNTGSQCRICRRAGEKLFLKGERCEGPKCSFTRRSYAPGLRTQRFRRLSDYGTQMREKQKAKAMYGLLERQFQRYVGEARKERNTGFALLRLLEMRVDNVVYRADWATSRAHARQLVSHGHIVVNGKRVTAASYICRPGDVVKIDHTPNKEEKVDRSVPTWLSVKGASCTVQAIESREQLDTTLNEQLIIEYYSR